MEIKGVWLMQPGAAADGSQAQEVGSLTGMANGSVTTFQLAAADTSSSPGGLTANALHHACSGDINVGRHHSECMHRKNGQPLVVNQHVMRHIMQLPSQQVHQSAEIAAQLGAVTRAVTLCIDGLKHLNTQHMPLNSSCVMLATFDWQDEK